MTREHAKKILTHLRNGKSDLMLMDALDMAISALSESDNKWIPVSERLPENSDYVLFCDIDNDVMVGYHNPNNQQATHFTEKGTWEDFKNVVAWQPLPKSYKAEKGGESGKKGEWIDNGNGSYTCSNCKTEWTTSQIEKMCFCPTCGNPKVRGDKAE